MENINAVMIADVRSKRPCGQVIGADGGERAFVFVGHSMDEIESEVRSFITKMKDSNRVDVKGLVINEEAFGGFPVIVIKKQRDGNSRNKSKTRAEQLQEQIDLAIDALRDEQRDIYDCHDLAIRTLKGE